MKSLVEEEVVASNLKLDLSLSLKSELNLMKVEL